MIVFCITSLLPPLTDPLRCVSSDNYLHCVSQVKSVMVEKKINEIVNRLDKTKEERSPNLAAEKESRDQEERNEKKAQLQDQKRKEKEEQKRRKEMEDLKYVQKSNIKVFFCLFVLGFIYFLSGLN